MTKIYENANKVYVWLGVPTEETELAIANIKAFEAVIENTYDKNYLSVIAHHRSPESGLRDLDPSLGLDILPIELAIIGGTPWQPMSEFCKPWEAVIDFWNNVYWSRVWVLQELTCPVEQAVEVILGRQLQTLPLR